MTTNFPAALDDFTNPTATDTLNSPAVPHHAQHANANDAIEALQAKVGADGSAVTTSLDYRVAAVETGKADTGHNHTGTYEPADATILKDADIGVTVAAISHAHDASHITTGTLDIARLPASVIERMVVVADDAARFALTTTNVQNGDVVKVESSGLMYFVKDEAQLGTESGYEVFKAGSAAAVPWTGVTGKPATYPPDTHTHDIGAFALPNLGAGVVHMNNYADAWRHFTTGAVTDGGGVTGNGNGTFNIAACDVVIRETADEDSALHVFRVAAAGPFTPVDNDVTYRKTSFKL